MTSKSEPIETDVRRAETELQELNERLKDRPICGPGKGSVGGSS
jgi:hypothetical protein